MRGVALIGDDEAIALPEGHRPAVSQFERQFAIHNVEDMTTVAPMIGDVACFVLYKPQS